MVRHDRAHKALGAEDNDGSAIVSPAYTNNLRKRAANDQEGVRNVKAKLSDSATGEPSTLLMGGSILQSVADRVANSASEENGMSYKNKFMDESEFGVHFGFLDVILDTIEKYLHILAAIDPTICDFHKFLGWKGQKIESPRVYMSYRSQYTYLQGRFKELWIYWQFFGPCPALPYRKPSLQTEGLKELALAELVHPWDYGKGARATGVSLLRPGCVDIVGQAENSMVWWQQRRTRLLF